MGEDNQSDASTSQAERFAQLAREIGADEDESRWERRLKDIAKQVPKDDKPAE